MAPVDDDGHAVEFDGRLHDQAIEVDVAFHQAAVLVGRVAERDVDRAEGLLRLGDLVADPGGRVEPDPDLADVVGVADALDDRAQPVGGRPPSIRTARPARTVMRTGPSSAPRSEATRSQTTVPSDVPSSGGSETSPPGSAETSPGLRQIPVSQAIGSRPSTVARRSVPAGEVMRTSRVRRQSSARRSARARIATKSAVIAPFRQASARCGALKTPRAPARWAAALAAV